jgi:hypothetical protein
VRVQASCLAAVGWRGLQASRRIAMWCERHCAMVRSALRFRASHLLSSLCIFGRWEAPLPTFCLVPTPCAFAPPTGPCHVWRYSCTCALFMHVLASWHLLTNYRVVIVGYWDIGILGYGGGAGVGRHRSCRRWDVEAEEVRQKVCEPIGLGRLLLWLVTSQTHIHATPSPIENYG